MNLLKQVIKIIGLFILFVILIIAFGQANNLLSIKQDLSKEISEDVVKPSNSNNYKIRSEIIYSIDRVGLNQNLTKVKNIGFLERWEFSDDNEKLKLYMNDDWNLLTQQQKATLTRRFLDIFAIQIKDASNMWDICVELMNNGIKLAEDCVSDANNGNNPKIFY